jgi:hypothetical protein
MPIQLTDAPTVSDQIPRRKSPTGGEGGPLVIPPGASHIPGDKQCPTCRRMVQRDKDFPRKGTCKCMWYQRTTTFIDVLQDEFLLKQWGNRNVAWGMAQRPDLQLLASSCKRPSEIESGSEDYRELNNVVAEAQREAGDKIKATIGTSLHKITHQMDRGETLGTVPARWRNDIAVYDSTIKSLGIEWVSIESFRVMDKWVKDVADCDHKAVRYGGACRCYGVAGTVDRIGWYRGRLRIFDIKTGSDFNKLGHAMQLAMYAHMVPYEYPGDTRGLDLAEVDQRIGYVIYLPEGKAECRLEPMDLTVGWKASQLAKQVWDARKWEAVLDNDTETLSVGYLVGRARSVTELRMIWDEQKRVDRLDTATKKLIRDRRKEIEAQEDSR